jgi:hypothetical protein
LSVEVSEDADHRRVRQSAVGGHAGARRRPCAALAGAGAELLDQSGLADAGVAADQDGRGLAATPRRSP